MEILMQTIYSVIKHIATIVKTLIKLKLFATDDWTYEVRKQYLKSYIILQIHLSSWNKVLTLLYIILKDIRHFV